MKAIKIDKEELRHAYHSLGSADKVADFFNVSKKTILNRMNAFGIERNQRNPHDFYKKDIIRMTKEGLTAKESALALNISIGHASLKAREYGVQFKNNYHVGFITTHSGYRMIYKPNSTDADSKGYVREHRYLMEQKIGRKLTKHEVVHHVNGIKSDNNIINLALMTIEDHVRLHHTGKVGRGSDNKPRKNAKI